MITTCVTVELPEALDAEEVRRTFTEGAKLYVNKPGLIRKYYVHSPDLKMFGGIFLWRDRSFPEAFFTDEWRRAVMDRYPGGVPTVAYLETPIVVDNLAEETLAEWGDA